MWARTPKSNPSAIKKQKDENDQNLREMVFGSQCTNCNGFPTERSIFKGAEALFKKCECKKYNARNQAAYNKLLKYEEEVL